jgi:hypothetical protein
VDKTYYGGRKRETIKNIELSREDCMDLLARSPDKPILSFEEAEKQAG